MHTKKDLEKDAALKGGNLMLESLCIPFIKKEVVKRGKYQTVAAWKLSNVLAMDLAFSQFLPKEPGVDQTGEKFSYLDNLYKNRAAFARAISSWPSNIIVELNMVSIPHLEWKLEGEVQYSFLLRVFSGSRGRVLTMALKYATIFQGLLNSCFPEVEFTPVKDPKVLGNICKPFTPNRATLILRHREHINIAESLAKNKIGFVVSLGEAKLEDPAATYSFPWTVNPLDTEYAVGFNILEWKTIQERDLIIDNLYQTLDQIYDMRTAGGPIFEHNFRNMLKLLMGDRRRRDFSPTLLYFPTLYLNGAFRSWLEQSIEDRVVKNFLRELERTSGEAHLSNSALCHFQIWQVCKRYHFEEDSWPEAFHDRY